MCDKSLSAQKIGFDILLRNSKVSVGGNILINDGPCYPPIGEYDLELIVLHEFGHALNLAHINDDYEKTSSNYNTINPAKLMHYAVLDFTNRRSPDASAFEGVLYTTEKQNNSYGNCGLFSEEMQTLPPIVEANDNCPSTFPSTPLVDGTSVVFDLVHATSNKYTDPSFEQVNCQSTGTFVTNNAYFAFETSDSIKQSLQINISGYTTVPAELNSCNEQGVRLALYDVSTCPQGQNFPQPITCNTFSSDGSVTPITGLIPNHKYLLYFDGIRNTKAIFNASFNRSDAAGINNTVSISPNPVQGLLSIRFLNTAVAQYQYALYDAGGKLINTATLNVSPIAFDYKINMTGLASGIYFLRVVNSKGDILTKQKILKVTQ